MAAMERFRQPLSGPLDFAALQQRLQEGWRIVAFEWERRTPQGESDQPRSHEVPFGAQITRDSTSLTENRVEIEVLFRMMELIVEEVPYTFVADELNRAGFRTRIGRRWNPVSVFEMLPRLIEVGPIIFFSEEWRRRRQGSTRAELSPRLDHRP